METWKWITSETSPTGIHYSAYSATLGIWIIVNLCKHQHGSAFCITIKSVSNASQLNNYTLPRMHIHTVLPRQGSTARRHGCFSEMRLQHHRVSLDRTTEELGGEERRVLSEEGWGRDDMYEWDCVCTTPLFLLPLFPHLLYHWHQSTHRPQASHKFCSTYKSRLANFTSCQLKYSLCKLLLHNSSQYSYSCHSVAIVSPTNFPVISKQITEQYYDFAQS